MQQPRKNLRFLPKHTLPTLMSLPTGSVLGGSVSPYMSSSVGSGSGGVGGSEGPPVGAAGGPITVQALLNRKAAKSAKKK